MVRLRLGGLSAEEICDFVARAVGDERVADLPQVARLLSELTGGNAFLMTELWRTLLESDAMAIYDGGPRLASALAELGSPEGVREVVSQRLARLDTGHDPTARARRRGRTRIRPVCDHAVGAGR